MGAEWSGIQGNLERTVCGYGARKTLNRERSSRKCSKDSERQSEWRQSCACKDFTLGFWQNRQIQMRHAGTSATWIRMWVGWEWMQEPEPLVDLWVWVWPLAVWCAVAKGVWYSHLARLVVGIWGWPEWWVGYGRRICRRGVSFKVNLVSTWSLT